MCTSTAVIIPTYNDTLIRDVVQAVCADVQGRADVFVVGHDDAGRLSGLGGFRFVDTQRRVNAAVARNLGIAATDADQLLFVDADCIIEPGWSDAHLRRLAGGCKVVGGSVRFPQPTSYWQLAYNVTLFHAVSTEKPPGQRPYLPTLNLAVARSVIDAVGGMDETLERGQDIDWTVRMAQAGFTLCFEPKAVIAHHPDRHSWRKVWLDCRRSGYFSVINRIKYASYYGSPRAIRSALLLRLLSPLVALFSTLAIFYRSPRLLRYAQTAPAIYLTKIAWCLGAADAVSAQPQVTHHDSKTQSADHRL